MITSATREAAAQLLHQLENLGLDRDVEGGRRLVGDDQLGLAAEGHRDHHPLAHAAAEMMGILAKTPLRIGDPDQAQQLHRARFGVRPRQAEVPAHPFGQLHADAEHRIERGHRFLEDHGDLATAHPGDLVLVEVEQIATLEADAPAGDPARVRDEAQNRERAHRFAAAGFADQGDRLAGIDRIGDPVDRLDHPVAATELDPEVVDCKQVHRLPFPGPSRHPADPAPGSRARLTSSNLGDRVRFFNGPIIPGSGAGPPLATLARNHPEAEPVTSGPNRIELPWTRALARELEAEALAALTTYASLGSERRRDRSTPGRGLRGWDG